MRWCDNNSQQDPLIYQRPQLGIITRKILFLHPRGLRWTSIADDLILVRHWQCKNFCSICYKTWPIFGWIDKQLRGSFFIFLQKNDCGDEPVWTTLSPYGTWIMCRSLALANGAKSCGGGFRTWFRTSSPVFLLGSKHQQLNWVSRNK